MAITAGTRTTYGAGSGIVGTREDLADTISNITPKETPFMTAAGSSEANNVLYEWQTDTLASPAANAQLEGDNASYTAPAETTRLSNYQQISTKTASVSGTAEVTKKAGRKSEMAFQIAKRAAELKLDMEKTAIGINQVAAAGSTTVARKTTNFLNWFNANNSTIGTGSAAHPVASGTGIGTARVDGTTRALTFALVKAGVVLGYNNGAKIDSLVLMAGVTQKQVISGFTGIATPTLPRSEAKPTAVVAAVDILVTDFGILSVVPNRHMRQSEVLGIDFDYVSFSYLRPFEKQVMAKTGDAENRLILTEWGIKVENPNAHFGVFDLT